MRTFISNIMLHTFFVIFTGLFFSACSSDGDENASVEETVVSSDEPVAVVDDNANAETLDNNPYSDPYVDDSLESNPYAANDDGTENPLDNELSRLNTIPVNDSGVEDDPVLAEPNTEPYLADESSSELRDGTYTNTTATGFGEYIVQPGDSLAKIADLIYGDYKRWADLAAENEIVNPSKILPGDVIRYAKRDGQLVSTNDTSSEAEYSNVTVEKGDTLTKLAVRIFGKSAYWRTLWRYNQETLPDPNRIQVGQVLRYLEPNSYKAAFRTATASGSTGH